MNQSLRREALGLNDHLKHPAHTLEARVKQLNEGITPDFGRGSCGGTTRLPQGKCWSPHTGERQKLRNLQRTWKRFEKICAREDRYKAARERLLDAVSEDPTPEYAAMNICLGALIASEEKQDLARRFPAPAGVTVPGIEWVDALEAALTQFEDNVEGEVPVEGAAV
jgi:hypothetical protein